MNEVQTIGAGATLNKQSEVEREMTRLNYNADQLDKLAQELIQRLASVISPRPDNPNKEVEDLNPTTPLATNLHELGNKLIHVEKGLRFILDGLEL